jgi:hypothetical protein
MEAERKVRAAIRRSFGVGFILPLSSEFRNEDSRRYSKSVKKGLVDPETRIPRSCWLVEHKRLDDDEKAAPL